MKSRWIINFFIVITIAVLALVARYEPGIEQPPGPQAVTGLKTDQVKKIRVIRPLRDDLILIRKPDDSWSLGGQPALPADPFQVRALARLVEQKAVRSYPAKDLDLEKLALDPAYASVIVNDVRVESGSLEPLQELRYLRVADQVHLVSDIFQHLIDADYTQFVRRSLFDETRRISELSLPGLRLHKSSGNWQVDPPQAVSADAIQQLVDRWRQATALYVRAADGEQPAEKIFVTLDEPAEVIEFLIVSRDPELILRRADYAIDYRMGQSGGALLNLEQPATEQSE